MMLELDGRCIMVVEDQFYLAKDVQQALKAAGADVLGPFADQEQALGCIEDRLPDCAILDVNFGNGARFELADSLRTKGVPFLFFTGYDRGMIPERFADVKRLQKPVDASRLVDAARSVCVQPTGLPC